MKTFIALLGTTVCVCGSQEALSNQAPVRLTTVPNSYDASDRGLMGACCLPDGSCVMEYATQCYSSWGGAYMGGDCSGNPCDAFSGACCTQGMCEVMFLVDCSGTFMGGGVDCSDVSCELEWSGACCYGVDECEIMGSLKCMNIGGVAYDMLSCEQVSCPNPCLPSDEIMFSSIAYPLSVECENPNLAIIFDHFFNKIDLNGDNVEEMIIEYSAFGSGELPTDRHGSFMKMGSINGSVKVSELIDLNPSSIAYSGVQFCEDITCRLKSFLDVTGDGLPDAIVYVSSYGLNGGCHSGYHYVENISIPPAAACASDINNDGSTNVNDLLAVVGNWGPCE